MQRANELFAKSKTCGTGMIACNLRAARSSDRMEAKEESRICAMVLAFLHIDLICDADTSYESLFVSRASLLQYQCSVHLTEKPSVFDRLVLVYTI